MIASRRWGVAIGWVLLVGAIYRVVVLLSPIYDDVENRLLTLAAVAGLMLLPMWIMAAAHELGYIRGATNDLTPPEQDVVERYKLKVRVKRKLIEEKVNRWREGYLDTAYPSDKDGYNPRDSSARG